MTDRNDNGQPRRWSLKWKWAIGTAIGTALIFVIFSILIYKSFTNLLLNQEQSSVREAITSVNSVLGTERKELTIDSVNAKLHPEESVQISQANQQSTTKLFSDSRLAAISRSNVAVTVYDKSGTALFVSRKDPHTFQATTDRQIKRLGDAGSQEIVGRAPIQSSLTHQTIGYVQVTNDLTQYHQTSHKLLLIFTVMTLIAIIGSALFGYFLAAYLLRPIDQISSTIHEIQGDAQSEARVPELHRNDELSDLAILFNDMLDQMQRFIQQQQQFVEDVSHELRTPVAIIQGHMELLNRWGKDDPQVLEESLTASLAETKRMQSLVQEMLDLSRAEQLEINYSQETTDVRQMVIQVYNDFKMIHPEFMFTLDNDTTEPLMVQIYRNHLEQVLIILLDNAVKYSTRRKEIHLSLSRDPRNVEIAVQDFGEGIAKNNLDKVFNRFYRVDKARSRDKGGNGLGLSIAKRLIEGYHGHISVESVVGHGSVFQIQLPLIQGNRKAVVDPLPPKSATSEQPLPAGIKPVEEAQQTSQSSVAADDADLPKGIMRATSDSKYQPLDDHASDHSDDSKEH